MSTQTINELPDTHNNNDLPLENFPMEGTTETTETMVDSTMNVSECSAYVSSPVETTCVAVIIGCNAPTRKSILISPSRTSSSSAHTHRTSLTAITTPPTPLDGIETETPATTRTNSLDSFIEDSVCEPSSSACQQGEELSPEQRLNVKFAPLPDVGPRKRRGVPLGVASRSRLVRRRQTRGGEPGAPSSQVVATPMWTDEEMEVQRLRLAKAWEKEREGRDYYSQVDENGDPIEDPITVLGRLVKVAGKQLWSKIGGREGKDERGKARAKETERMRGDALVEEQHDFDERPARYSTSSVSSSQTDHTSSSVEEQTPVPDGSGKKVESWEEIRRKEIPPSQPDDARKRSLWRRTRTMSKIDDDSSSSPIFKASLSKNFPIRSFSGWKSDANKGRVESKGGSSGLRRSLSF